MLIMAVSLSCDETSAAVLRGGREVLSDVISSQIAIHQKYKGVVPGDSVKMPHAVYSCRGTGGGTKGGNRMERYRCRGCYRGTGFGGRTPGRRIFGKGLSYSLGVPFVGVHHIEGHISANFITNKRLNPRLWRLSFQVGTAI